jgi:hypothetical protein
MIVILHFPKIVGGPVGSGRVEDFRKISGVSFGFGPRNFRENFDHCKFRWYQQENYAMPLPKRDNERQL